MPPPTRAVDRALALLVAVCEANSVPLAEAARQVDLPPSTALRLLRTLESWDLVSRKDDGEYWAGPRLMQLAARAAGEDILSRHAHPHLEALVASTGESAYISVRGPGRTALYIGQVEGTHAIRHRSWVGQTVPLDGTAAGTALLGAAPAEGYAILRSTLEPDVTAVAAPVTAHDGSVLGALSIVGPTFRIDDETVTRFGRVILTHTRALSEELGHGDWPEERR